MKDILIIGGAGFIGSHLVDKLVKDKNNKITIIDNLSTGSLDNIIDSLYNITFIPLDFLLYNEFKKFDIIYLLAAKTNDRSEYIKDYAYNIELVTKAISYLNNKGVFYFFSSGSIYGDKSSFQEETSTNPITLYGKSKKIGEDIIKDIFSRYFIFRIGNVFGERQNGKTECGIVAIIKSKKEEKKILDVYNKGESKRDYIYVKELVDAIILPKVYGTYNVGTGKSHKTIELIEASKVKYRFSGSRKEGKEVKLNTNKLRKVGWNSKINVVEYIKENL